MEMMNYGLIAAAVGIAAIIIALVVLIVLVKAMAKGAVCINNGKVTFDMSAYAKPKKAAPIVVETVNVNDDQVVAVITAAIAAIMEEEQKDVPAAKKGFVVRSIRRVSNAPAWNRAGREEQIYSRM
ncbi:MAG: hypothetical protein IJ313_01900 [Clostridia bacterium]|nr:hypothetical protein [Clostridia bacterium]